jgi:oligopeptide transport system permease protein
VKGTRERAAAPLLDMQGSGLDLALAKARQPGGESLARDAWRRLRADKGAWRSLLFLAAMTLVSLLAPLLPLPSPVALQLRAEPQPPTWPWKQPFTASYVPEYWELGALDGWMVSARRAVFGSLQTGSWLGTDAKGRDLLSRLVWGSRTSLLVACAAAFASLCIGVSWGAIAGLAGGRVDHWMMRAVDVLYALPFTFVVIFVLALLDAPRGASGARPFVPREVVFFAAIGAVWWLSMARVVRGQVLALRRSAFVESARALGASTARIAWTHVVPNVLPVVIVYLTLTLPSVVLFESFLSFLGLGIEPPKVSWGLLAADGVDALNPLGLYWWLVVFPALAMGSTLLALNLLGDGLRDALDPRRRGALR